MIRNAVPDDIPRLVEMGARFHQMSPHRTMGDYDRVSIARMLEFMITSPSCIVLVNGYGLIGGVLSPVYFNPQKTMCEESFWWAEKGGRDLLKALESAARDRGADFVLLSALENEHQCAIERIVEHHGFRRIEHRYLKELH